MISMTIILVANFDLKKNQNFGLKKKQNFDKKLLE